MLLELAADGHFNTFQRLERLRVTIVIQDLGDSLHVGYGETEQQRRGDDHAVSDR